jgi:hypothetical protein
VTHVAYRWADDVFCEEDIVAAMTDHEPWKAWADAGNVPGEGRADDDLLDIAFFFTIDLDDPEELANVGWPVKMDEPPDPPEICSGCLCWFS